MKNFRKGFTLIELLVVIAIVGLLASVVLASLQSARNKAADAKVKETLVQLRSQAELVLSNNAGVDYTGLFDAGTNGLAVYQSARAAGADYDGDGSEDATDGGYQICDVGVSPYWYAWTRLKGNTGTVWYVDGTGVSEVRTVAPTLQVTVLCTS